MVQGFLLTGGSTAHHERLTKSTYNINLLLCQRRYRYDFTGGFYSDTKAFVSDSCLKCPNGTFVHYNKAPGVSPLDCIACPQGKIYELETYLAGHKRGTSVATKHARDAVSTSSTTHKPFLYIT